MASPDKAGVQTAGPQAASDLSETAGIWLVFGSALAWSFGGVFSRYLDIDDNWTIVFWRSFWAAAFLLAFMLWRDGPRGTLALITGMRLPSLAVALCFATASTSFIVALSHTTVANILLMQAGVPLIAALMAWIFFREKVTRATAIAIAMVIAGVGVMVSQSLSGTISPIGDALALVISFAFALATVITRRYSHVRMVPAVFLGISIAGLIGFINAGSLAVSPAEMAILFGFGAINLGAGLAMFVTGARVVPAALTALIGTGEPVLGPIWVWLFHGEVPSVSTIIGGAIVMTALVWHISRELISHDRKRVLPPAA
jgi:drug/metabolite transporter (DMT)-like permease